MAVLVFTCQHKGKDMVSGIRTDAREPFPVRELPVSLFCGGVPLALAKAPSPTAAPACAFAANF
jgi:hypothetical protein